eukprot:CAMPEP_0177779206 /NCGR_PEP_ID=MMETSP0491_2-20121128/16441_1 /TAXON_ID=63592 /ORGANISM="Tetraselmis chuii, Strain PLY429" /LENGTH=1290 /DNA_ID=CAMNT_0019298685 /DNA_START=350 /DNA_END=4222 /DNA_ORIENTATION=+
MAVSTTYSAARNNKRHLLMMPPVAGLHLLLLVLLLRRDSSERRWFQPSSPSCAGFAASQSLESADNFIDAGHFNPEDGACGDLGPWTEGMCLSDGTAGGENEHCGPCLVGEAWDLLRATLGTEEVRRARSTVPTIKHAQWLSSTLAGTVIHILLKELLGYDRIRVVTTGNQFEIEEAASEACQGINMEVWLTEPEVEQRLLVEAMDAQPGRAVAGLTGGVGSESLFVPSYLPFSSTHYWPLQENVREERNGSLMRPMERFPPDGSFGAEQLASAFPAGDPWGCSTAGYGYGTFVCTAGRWYPPQCGQDGFPSKYCAELYIPDQTWSAGWWEAVTQNLALNFSSVYTSVKGLSQLMREKYEKNEGFMYQWWEPDPLPRHFPSRKVTFPRYSRECSSKYNRNPSLSGVNCDRDAVPLRKLIYAGLARSDPDIFMLWNAARFSNAELEALMNFHTDGGGDNSSMYGAACEWLKSNATQTNWLSWLNINEPCAGRVPAQTWNTSSHSCQLVESLGEREIFPASEGDSGGGNMHLSAQIGIAVGVAIAVVAALSVFVVFVMRKGAASFRAVGPPKLGGNVTLVITDIQGSTSLWDMYPAEMARDIALHHRCLRATLKEFHGYEIATEGDSFKCAFHTPEDAIQWAISVQMDLLCAPWSEQIEDGGWGAFGDTSKWGDPSKLADLSRQGDRRVARRPSHLLRMAAECGGKKRKKVLFNVASAADSIYSKNFCAQMPYATVFHASSGSTLPVFRGLRVRIGIHTGTADVVGTHENTKRVTYGGQVMATAKAISDVPAGGQIVASAETIAAIGSMHTLEQQVRELLCGWSTTGREEEQQPAAVSIVHMGSHLLSRVAAPEPMKPRSIAVAMRDSQNDTSVRDGISDRAWATVEERLSQGSVSEGVVPSALEKAQDLVSIVPFALRSRSVCFPPLDTVQQLTPGFWAAPAREGVTIVFTLVENWTQLKLHAQTNTSFRHVLDATREQLNLLVRAALLPTRGYEVEGEDGCFVLAFHSAEEAVGFAVLLQQTLRLADCWIPELLAMPGCEPLRDDEGQLVAVGPRIKVGMCTADAQVAQPSMRTGRAEYFGWLMNHAARVAATANGGQILVHECTHEALDMGELDSELIFKPHGTHRLKGIKSQIEIFEVCDEQLRNYVFPGLQRVSERDLAPVMDRISDPGNNGSRGRMRKRPTRSKTSFTDLALLVASGLQTGLSRTSSRGSSSRLETSGANSKRTPPMETIGSADMEMGLVMPDVSNSRRTSTSEGSPTPRSPWAELPGTPSVSTGSIPFEDTRGNA